MWKVIFVLNRAVLMVAIVLLLYLPAKWLSKRGSEYTSSAIPPASDRHLITSASVNRTRCTDLANQYRGSIPPLVHWTSKDGRVAAKLQPMVRSWRPLLNSSAAAWRFMHWDDRQLTQLIADHYPQIRTSYAKLVNGLERSDIGRLVVLHHMGGVYVDMDVEFRRDISSLLAPSRLMGNTRGNSSNLTSPTAIWAQEPPEHALFLFNMKRLMTNAVVLSRANHSFLSYVLRSWPAWFEANWAGKTGRRHCDAVFVTGPVMLHALYERYSSLPPADRPPDWSGTLLADPDMFQPVWDTAYVPGRVRSACAKLAQLSEEKRQVCVRRAKTNFQTNPVPAGSFTVHRYMHLSYSAKMDLQNSKDISELVPLLYCKL